MLKVPLHIFSLLTAALFLSGLWGCPAEQTSPHKATRAPRATSLKKPPAKPALTQDAVISGLRAWPRTQWNTIATKMTATTQFAWPGQGMRPIQGGENILKRLRVLATSHRDRTLKLEQVLQTEELTVVQATLTSRAPAIPALHLVAFFQWQDASLTQITLYGNDYFPKGVAGFKLKPMPFKTLSGPGDEAITQKLKSRWSKGLIPLVSEDVIFEDRATGTRLQGRLPLAQRQRAYAKLLPDGVCHPEDIVVIGTRAVIRSTCRGTYQGPMGKSPVDVTVHLANVATLQNDTITRLVSYSNLREMASQLGLLKRPKTSRPTPRRQKKP
jgi:hypothetical protein